MPRRSGRFWRRRRSLGRGGWRGCEYEDLIADPIGGNCPGRMASLGLEITPEFARGRLWGIWNPVREYRAAGGRRAEREKREANAGVSGGARVDARGVWA